VGETDLIGDPLVQAIDDTDADETNEQLLIGESDDSVVQATDDIAADDINEQLLTSDEISVTVEPDNQQNVEDTCDRAGVEVRSRRKRIPNKRVFNDDFVVNQARLNQQSDPVTVEDALKSPNAENWKKAMEEEIQAHAENQTWVLSDLPAGRKAIKCKWIFKTKLDADGHIERYKARLVAKGCSQQPGIDYEETYSPVVRYTSIRLLLALGAKYNLDIDQMDVTTAFLHPDLDEEIYMELPDGYKLNGEVCRLKKSIYGLKQASRAWNKKLDQLLKDFEFKQSDFDPCVYYKINNGKILIPAVYVDDLIVLSNDKKEKRKLKAHLMKYLKMKDLGEIHHCLGIRIQRDQAAGTISLDQEKYIEQVLNRFNMSSCNGASTPIDLNVDLFSDDLLPDTAEEVAEMQRIPFQEAVGCIMYIAQGMRPDIVHAVGLMSRFNSNYGRVHWTAVKRILRYLSQTWNLKLVYSNVDDELVGFSDSDWGGDKKDLKSTTGYTFILSGAAVSWNSKKQPTVAKCTSEAEYMALSMAASEAVWLKGIHRELVPGAPEVVTIHCDNKGAIDLARNPGYRPKMKHISIQHHFIRDRITAGDICVDKVASEDMIADCLTKRLPKDGHNKCVSRLGLM